MNAAYEAAARRVLSRSVEDPIEGCIRYTGGVNDSGYGCSVRVDGRFISPHRLMYVAASGAPIPDGLTLDHLCHTNSQCTGDSDCLHRLCVNPAHLEPVTAAENLRRQWSARKPACSNGHEYTPENTYRRPTGGRDCRACIRDRAARYKARSAA